MASSVSIGGVSWGSQSIPAFPGAIGLISSSLQHRLGSLLRGLSHAPMGAPQEAPAAGTPSIDPEFDRTPFQERLWVGCDLVGALRNIASVAGNVLQLFNKPVAALALGAIVPPSLVFTGSMCMYTYCAHVITPAKAALAAVELDDLEGKRVARMGVCNAHGLCAMGATAALYGSVAMMSPDFCNVVHWQPALSSSAASVGAAVTGYIYGAVLVGRGSIMTGRALYNLSYIYDFHQGFHDRLSELRELQPGAVTEARLHGVLDSAVHYVQRDRYDGASGKETQWFQRRVGEGLHREPNPGASLDEKIEWLAEVDKAIHTKELQQKLSLVIGLALLIGGILLIAATIATGGSMAVIGIGITSGILFTTAESVFLPYDSTWLFKKLQKCLYTESPLIAKARQLTGQYPARAVWADRMKEVAQLPCFNPLYYGIYCPSRAL